MPESWGLVQASEERGDDLASPIGEEMEVELSSQYLLSPDLRVLPCGSPEPRGEDLGSRIVKGKSLFLVSWIFQCGLSHPTSHWVNGGMTGRGRHQAASAQVLWASAIGGQTSKHRPALVFYKSEAAALAGERKDTE